MYAFHDGEDYEKGISKNGQRDFREASGRLEESLGPSSLGKMFYVVGYQKREPYVETN